MRAFRLDVKAAWSGNDAIVASSSTSPLGNACRMLRGCKKSPSVEKSSHRGIVTEQSHDLYAASQSEQLRASEYRWDAGASQGICWRTFLKFSYMDEA